MLTKRVFALLCGLSAGLCGWASGAAANSVTINNMVGSSQQTVVESYSVGSGATNNFFVQSTTTGQTTDPGYNSANWGSGNSYWGPNVGSATTGGGDYQTTGLTATYAAGNGSTSFGSVTLTFDTNFAANPGLVDSVCCGRSVYAADIFIKSNAAGDTVPPQSFNFAISLGVTQETSYDGGIAEGLYEGTTQTPLTDKTSQQIWGSSGIDAVYGGAFASESSFANGGPCTEGSSTCSASEASPTVLTGGALQTNIGVSVTQCETDSCSAAGAPTPAGGEPTLTVTLTADNAAGGSELSSIFSDFDIFWGTGDCSNAPIWGNVAGLTSAVPEPSSLALLLTAAIGIFVIRRRKRMPSTVA